MFAKRLDNDRKEMNEKTQKGNIIKTEANAALDQYERVRESEFELNNTDSKPVTIK